MIVARKRGIGRRTIGDQNFRMDEESLQVNRLVNVEFDDTITKIELHIPWPIVGTTYWLKWELR